MKEPKAHQLAVRIEELDFETFIEGLRLLQTTQGIRGAVTFPIFWQEWKTVDGSPQKNPLAFVPEKWFKDMRAQKK